MMTIKTSKYRAHPDNKTDRFHLHFFFGLILIATTADS